MQTSSLLVCVCVKEDKHMIQTHIQHQLTKVFLLLNLTSRFLGLIAQETKSTYLTILGYPLGASDCVPDYLDGETTKNSAEEEHFA